MKPVTVIRRKKKKLLAAFLLGITVCVIIMATRHNKKQKWDDLRDPKHNQGGKPLLHDQTRVVSTSAQAVKDNEAVLRDLERRLNRETNDVMGLIDRALGEKLTAGETIAAGHEDPFAGLHVNKDVIDPFAGLRLSKGPTFVGEWNGSPAPGLSNQQLPRMNIDAIQSNNQYPNQTLLGGKVTDDPILDDAGEDKWLKNGVSFRTLDNETKEAVVYGLGDVMSTDGSVTEVAARNETRHLFFLKVHKAASTTIQNIIFRFALKRHLVVLVPSRTHLNVLSEKPRQHHHHHHDNWTTNADPLPRGADHFDILCNHVVFEEKSVRKMLPRDTVFVGIVRRPFDQFLSAFWFYRENFHRDYLAKIPGPRPVSTYLQNITRWEASDESGMSFTRNRMSVDFGMDVDKLRKAAYVKEYIHYLNRTFHLVMVSERFDESVLLLRRLLAWKVEDVIYVRNNVNHHGYDKGDFTVVERQAHAEANQADYALYGHFSRVFDAKVRALGEGFAKEVQAFKILREAVDDYCRGNPGQGGPMQVDAAEWREEFVVTRESCGLMTKEEVKFTELVRRVNHSSWRRKMAEGDRHGGSTSGG